MSKSLNEVSAVEMCRRISGGETTVRKVAEAHLERIAEREETVGAFIHIDPDGVRATADRLDAEGPGFPLHGVPVAVKDIIDTADMPTGYGSEIYAGHQPEKDADIVAQTRRSGGLILGKTVSTEFAWRKPGKTVNPHDPTRTPGGSSSGSAAAVADCMAPFAFGTQTAGSVIRPAAYCGVVGYKPTFGRYPRSGVKELAGYLDTVGTFARSVVDISFIDAAIRDEPPVNLDVFEGGAPRLGLFLPFADKADRDAISAVEYMRKLAESAGASVIDVSGWDGFEEMDAVHATIMTAEAARALDVEYTEHFDQLSPFYQETLAKGRAIPEDTYFQSLAAADAFRNEAAAQMDGLDGILTLPAPGEAPVGLDFTGEPMFNRIWTMLRWPCVTIPVGRGTHGAPVGAQIVTGYGQDARALAVSHWLETLIEGVARGAAAQNAAH